MTSHPEISDSAPTMEAKRRDQSYEFVLRGEIGDRFAPLFDGMRLQRTPGHTVLTGPVLDQAHLHGLIERIAEVGVDLVSVNPLAPPDARKDRP